MKPFPFLVFVSFLLSVVHSPAADPADDTAPLPAPPMQGKPWTPPETKLPPVVVSAIKELFDQGMADPRGCEYREVEIASAVPSDEKAATKVHAWVLPADGKARFCVAWNGLEYPVTAVGGAADIQADMLSGPPDDKKCFSTRWAEYDFNTISEKSAVPVKAALLLRIGETRLAGQVWHEGWQTWTGTWVTDEAGVKSDPYANMAQEWLDALYGRALAAHTEGKDPLALQLFRELSPLVKMVKETAVKRGIPEKTPYGDGFLYYLDELRQLPDLIADQERRAQEPPYTPVLISGTPAPASGPEFIAALVRDLERVHGVEFMSPGDNDPITDPIVQALIRQGEPAVEPLIACLEEDPPRMTRNIYSYRERFQGPVEYVYEPAYTALTTILQTTVAIPLPKDTSRHELSLEDRKALAAKFRAWWSRYKNMTPPERWFSVLQDDNASPGEWFKAVTNIAQPTDQIMSGPNLFTGGWMGSGGPDPSVGMRGEPLRARKNPSVSDLIVKRFLQLLPAAKVEDRSASMNPVDPEVDRAVSYTKIGNLLVELADWDGKARLGDLKQLSQKLNAKFQNVSELSSSSDDINIKLYRKRAALGDPTALQEYAGWLLTLTPKTAYGSTVLPLMSQYPDDPVIRKISAKIFLDPHSPWHPSSPEALRGFRDLVNTRLLCVAAFREELLAILNDTTPMGFTRILGTSEPDIQMDDQHDYWQKERAGLPKVDFRVCDYYAARLQDIREFPEFQLTWPRPRRDTVLARMRQFLKQYGGDYRRISTSFPDNEGWPNVQINMPALDHPATAEDVAQGRAIFALTGETRLCPMPKFPIYAGRPGSLEGADTSLEGTPDGKVRMVTNYDANGWVWQAEEVKVGGKWQRFYGFAGRHQLEKVPASEIVFTGGNTGWSLTPQVNGILDLQAGFGPPRLLFTPHIISGSETPLPAVLKAYNHTGLDQEVPCEYILPPNAGKSLPSTISLSLAYSEKIPPEWGQGYFGFMSSTVPFDFGAWKEVPLRKDVTPVAVSAPDAVLAPAAELTLAQFDLRDYFDVSKPGTYHLRAAFHPEGKPAVASPEVTFTVLGKTN